MPVVVHRHSNVAEYSIKRGGAERRVGSPNECHAPGRAATANIGAELGVCPTAW